MTGKILILKTVQLSSIGFHHVKRNSTPFGVRFQASISSFIERSDLQERGDAV